MHRDVLEDGAQTQLQALLDSLIRLKQQHIFPPSGSASDVSASSPLTRSALSHQDAALLEEESRKLRVANRKLSETGLCLLPPPIHRPFLCLKVLTLGSGGSRDASAHDSVAERADILAQRPVRRAGRLDERVQETPHGHVWKARWERGG